MKPFRVIVAGCGGMSKVWTDFASERTDVEIVGLVDIREESAKAVAQRYQLDVPTFTDIESALREVPSANVVFDVTIPESRYEIVTAAMRAGCHVFAEKPMAVDLEEARSMVQLAEQHGVSYAVMQNRRYMPTIRAVRSGLASGLIGRVGEMHADFYIGAHFGGFRDVMDHPLILDMAIHTFDQARFMIGADPVSVYCHEFNPPGSWYQGNASAICIYEMSDGSVFTYRGSWCSEGMNTPWEANWRIIGERGTMVWKDGEWPTCECIDESQPLKFMHAYKHVTVPEASDVVRDGHMGCLDEMFAAIIAGRKAETDARDNIQSIAMVLCAIESARTGRKIAINALA
jgi:predicted dehydrogenase